MVREGAETCWKCHPSLLQFIHTFRGKSIMCADTCHKAHHMAVDGARKAAERPRTPLRPPCIVVKLAGVGWLL